MRLVLDGVFNHCGRGFWAFHHLVENGQNSPYRDWFHVHRWPVQPYPSDGEDCGYDAWWGGAGSPQVQSQQSSRSTCWRWGSTGWNGASMDGGWTFQLRCQRILGGVPAGGSGVNPEAWIVGEIGGTPAIG